jgi:hypothetical protein
LPKKFIEINDHIVWHDKTLSEELASKFRSIISEAMAGKSLAAMPAVLPLF